ncbi:hypothetical protein GB931_09490 [Modestobacter sp. I12A-02628]|uniref:Uncharacterized protein n=1 Tax=Goekera deserti TaxID=2497753 RepID=A0A7K3WKT8_9ACTN|nr:hypothetical protein [Goekera deserti]MPQ98149.1 hypothetical protein [Goekera deserti]NDI48798.1 hypothetical protein [Goekera deserti]NEL56479.1 hypothetical protein [Goekera deserti]
MSDPLTVQLDVLDGLAAELTALGAELADDAHVSTACGTSLGWSLDGGPGAETAAVGHEWGTVLGLLAGRATEVGATLSAAVAGYRALDRSAAELVAGARGRSAVAR